MFKKGMSLNGIPFLFELIGDPLTATLFYGAQNETYIED